LPDLFDPRARLQSQAWALKRGAKAATAAAPSRDGVPDLIIIKAARGKKSFRYFFEHFAWPVLQPGRGFVDNWHVHVLCEHMEALKRGQIRKLLVNLPFRMLKSSIMSQAFQAWDWIDNPSRQYLTGSYSKDVATRDAVETRKIIESPLYRAAYGDRFRMSSDQNVKTRFENDKRGSRIITSTDAAVMGFGGDVRLLDDPVSAQQANSLIAINNSIEFYRGAFATRANDPGDIRIAVVHQRVHVDDLTGWLLANEDGWEHLIFPFRYEPDNKLLRKTTSLGFHDPRTTEGELIHPSRIDETSAAALEKTLGSYHTKAQLQQDPEPRGGVIFKRDEWKYWKVLPEIDEIVITVDCTFKDLQTSDHVAIQAWGAKYGGANTYLLPGRIKERMGFAATVQAVRNMKALYPDAIAVLIEDKANGSAVIETLTDEIQGVLAIQPEGGKAARAYAMQPTQEAGNVWLPDPSVDPTIEQFVGTCSKFTGAEGGDDDEVDAMTQYQNWRRVREKGSGLQDFMREQMEAKKG
jgi:predicted phage terminase large subunit-like protein